MIDNEIESSQQARERESQSNAADSSFFVIVVGARLMADLFRCSTLISFLVSLFFCALFRFVSFLPFYFFLCKSSSNQKIRFSFVVVGRRGGRGLVLFFVNFFY